MSWLAMTIFGSAASVPGISATVSPGLAYGEAFVSAPTVVFTNGVTVTAFGGAAYSYAWSLSSGDAMTVTSPSSASTTFSQRLAIGDAFNAVYQCIVTETTTLQAAIVYVSVQILELH